MRAKLKSLDPLTSLGPSTAVQVIEMSRHGFKIFATRSYLPNSVVLLRMSRELITGRVRHCTPVSGGFHLGIERTKLGL
jgi:hypothetical protein